LNLFIDFETYYSRASEYDLKSISMTDYIMDPRFKAHGVGVLPEGGKLTWVSHKDIPEWIKSVDWANTTVVAHNVKFDGAILAWRYGVKPQAWIDTKCLAKAVLGTTISGFSLGTVAAYLGLPAKGELKADGVVDLDSQQEQEMASYCLTDVQICQLLYAKLSPAFPSSQWEILDWSIKCFIEPELVVDSAIATEVFVQLQKDQENLISKTGLDKEVFSSNPKFAELLRNRGFHVPMKISPRTQKMIPALSLNDPEFLNMRDNADGELKTLCEARVAAKQTMERTRAEKLASIGRYSNYPFDVEFSGAKQTHRFSGGNGAGGNPQNFKRDSRLREAIKAPNGYSVVCADFSNIELRVLAYLSRAKYIISGIEQGIDLYCDYGSKYYKRVITKKDILERQFSKVAVLGLGYNMGPEKFQSTVRKAVGTTISLDAAKEAVYLYRGINPELKVFWDRCQGLMPVMQQGYKTDFVAGIQTGKECLILPSGLRIQYPGLQQAGREWQYMTYKKSKQKEAVKIYGGKITENICQALAGEICKEAISRLLRVGLRPIGQVHDEVLLVCKEKDEVEVMEAVYKAMTDPMPWWPEIKLDASVGVGPNWSEAK
jgi:DNA polymerase III epsilon subunit-like protein